LYQCVAPIVPKEQRRNRFIDARHALHAVQIFLWEPGLEHPEERRGKPRNKRIRRCEFPESSILIKDHWVKENEMKASMVLAVAVVGLVSAAAANAETYEGVHQAQSSVLRADVDAQALSASRAGNAYGEAAASGVAPPTASSTDRSAVHKDAVAASRARNQNLDRKAFFNSVLPGQFTGATSKN
jgi:hypothetical protein